MSEWKMIHDNNLNDRYGDRKKIKCDRSLL